MPENKTIFFKRGIFCFLGAIFFSFAAQGANDFIQTYVKKERNSGYFLRMNNEREELRTDESRYFEKGKNALLQYNYSYKTWNYLSSSQESRGFSIETGPFGSKGSVIDSLKKHNIEADHVSAGIDLKVTADYLNRIYYTSKNYTMVQANGWSSLDIFNRDENGTVTDSNSVIKPYVHKGIKSKIRIGLQAAAAWGYGRLNPVNHIMVSEYLLEKYYKGRVFSDNEVVNLSKKIAEIKHKRELPFEHSVEDEADALKNYLNQNMILQVPTDLNNEWMYGEFFPRFSGKRIEIGPFFNYFNREPDFIYGGNIKLENLKYRSRKWNRNFTAEIRYNRYKKSDWIILETILGWSYYKNLKSQIDFGLKYMPGFVVNDFKDIQPVKHNIIPYLGYYTQLNNNKRVNILVAYRISQGEQFLLPGPEIKVSVYRSRY